MSDAALFASGSDDQTHRKLCTSEQNEPKKHRKNSKMESKVPVVEVTAPDGRRSLWAVAVTPENAVAVVAMPMSV
jgi:hypothetical protein